MLIYSQGKSEKYSGVVAHNDGTIVVRGEGLGRLLNDGIVLDICETANAHKMDIATHSDIVPDRSIVPYLTTM